MIKKTLVIGASENPERFSNRVVRKLQSRDIPVVALGLREGEINGIKIITGKPTLENIHTITLYVGEKNQPQYYDYILSLKPQRIIFNPGAENPELMKMASDKGIETLEACTLTILSIGSF